MRRKIPSTTALVSYPIKRVRVVGTLVRVGQIQCHKSAFKAYNNIGFFARVAELVDCTGLENQRILKGPVGSNPTASAKISRCFFILD